MKGLMKAKITMPLSDFFLLYKLAKKDECDIGTFIRRCVANELGRRYTYEELEEIDEKQFSESDWKWFHKMKIE